MFTFSNTAWLTGPDSLTALLPLQTQNVTTLTEELTTFRARYSVQLLYTLLLLLLSQISLGTVHLFN